MKRYASALSLLVVLATAASGQIIFNNGSMITHATGGGVAGIDPVSALQTNLGLGTYGPTNGGTFRLADDFTVPCGESWTINSFKVFSYITQAAAPFNTTSPFTSANYKIWNGKPGTAGATVLFDFSAANQMTTTAWSGIYRTTITTLTNLQRPIMAINMNGNGTVLGPGQYWLDFQVGPSGFSPYVSILNNPTTGDGIQFIAAAAAWNNVLTDAGFSQGVPIEIDHSTTTVGCFQLNISQPGGPGAPLFLNDSGGTPGNTFVNVITLNSGAFPNGWLFGVDISIPELLSELNAGLPFTGTLDGSGSFLLPPVVLGLPFPITAYYVGIELNGPTVVSADAAKSVTINP